MKLKNPKIAYQAFSGSNGTYIYIVNDENFKGAKLATASLSDVVAARRSGAIGFGDIVAYLSHTAGGNHHIIDIECVKSYWKSIGPELVSITASAIALFYKNVLGKDLDAEIDNNCDNPPLLSAFYSETVKEIIISNSCPNNCWEYVEIFRSSTSEFADSFSIGVSLCGMMTNDVNIRGGDYCYWIRGTELTPGGLVSSLSGPFCITVTNELQPEIFGSIHNPITLTTPETFLDIYGIRFYPFTPIDISITDTFDASEKYTILSDQKGFFRFSLNIEAYPKGEWQVYADERNSEIRSNLLIMTSAPYVTAEPTTGFKSQMTTIFENGHYFTPYKTATLHFIDPDGVHTTILKDVGYDGSYIHSYTCHSETAEGIWEYYAVDDETDLRTPSIFFTIEP